MVPRYKGSATSRSSYQELKEKIGQHFIAAVDSHFVNEDIETLTKLTKLETSYFLRKHLYHDNTFDVVIDDLPANLTPGLIGRLCGETDYGIDMKEAVIGLKAGSDYVMMCHTLRARVGAMQAIIASIKSGEISQLAIQSLVD
ncbi:hypothetical protein BGAL_0089g00320 [Botrytis galanthina]|uniref:Uncharacterized protein n=1 Tax=Botrytis galanthina TaxID=278940 RepID=A0A4S8RF39_9HELO|nr:hypothetical protein BGAL_0089g00320 [Botrytis galanthina]